MILLKIGGGVITDEKAGDAFKPDVARAYARLIRGLVSGGDRMVVVHGGGLSELLQKNDPTCPPGYLPREKSGFAALMRNRTDMLHGMVMDAFLDEGVPAASVSTGSIIRSHGGIIISFKHEAVTAYLNRGMVPVMHSDIVPDRDEGFHLCTCHHIVRELAKLLLPDTVVIATDADGVYADGSGSPESDRPLRSISALDFHVIRDDLDGGEEVPGGKREMVKIALDTARYCRNCIIVNGSIPERVAEALKGKEVIGTRVVAAWR